MQETVENRHKTGGFSLRVRQILFIGVTYLILVALCFAVLSPQQYDLSVGDVSPATITAGRDIVDEITTERRRQAAIDAVSPVYYKDESVSEAVLSEMEGIFSELRSARELGQQIKAGWENGVGAFTESDYAQATGLIPSLSLSNYQLRTLMNTSESDFEILYQSLMSATKTTLVSNINEGKVSDAINNIQQIVAYNTRTDLWYNIAIPTLRATLQANMLIDQEATEQNRQKAADAVEPTVYKRDQNIVVKGSRVTAEQIAVLDALGVLQGDGIDPWLYIGTALILAFILGVLAVYALLFMPSAFTMGKNAVVMLLIGAVTLILCLAANQALGVAAMPVVLAAMLTVNLIGAGPAFLTNSCLALVLTFLTFKAESMPTVQLLDVLLMTSVGGMLSIFLLRKNPTRLFVLIAGLLVGLADMAVLSCVALLTSAETVRTVLTGALPALLSAEFSAILCVGLQPILETAFNLVTPSKLIELSDPNQPLLRRLMIETPGTYHHSMIVANLAEAAAEAVGADALLARVGAYYHDIGKLVRPLYFKENQLGENPHDTTDPKVSAAILTEHPRDGVELARKHHLPQAIIDIICQHHGDTPVMYFYAKAVKQYGEENVDLADFRYDGPKPQTEEAAILMLADTVEAAVRSIPDPTPEKISAMIRKLVRGKMEDGQLDECTLTFRDIGRICKAFETVLAGVFHERIEYPDINLNRAKRHQGKKKKGVVSDKGHAPAASSRASSAAVKEEKDARLEHEADH